MCPSIFLHFVMHDNNPRFLCAVLMLMGKVFGFDVSESLGKEMSISVERLPIG